MKIKITLNITTFSGETILNFFFPHSHNEEKKLDNKTIKLTKTDSRQSF